MGTFLYSLSMEQHRLVFRNAEILGASGVVGLRILGISGSFCAINGIQLQVKFTQAVDEDSAEDIASYTITKDGDAVELADKAVSLKDDEVTAVITLPEAVANDDSQVYVITVNPVESKDTATVKTKVFSTTVSVSDETAPTITKVEAVTNGDSADTLEVTFSEPISSGVIKIDGVSYGSAATVLASDADATSNKVTIEDLDLSADESHTLTVVNLQDAAGNIESSITKTFNVTVDADAPEIKSLTAESDSQIKVVFNKEMDPDTIVEGNITVRDESYTGLDYDLSAPNDDNDTWTITINDATLFDNKDTRTLTLVFDEGVEDSNGNAIVDNTTKTIKLTKDTVDPTVESLSYNTVDDEVTEVVATFSENVQGDADSYPVVIDPDGIVVEGFFNGATYDDNKVTYDVADPADLTGKYTFRFASGTVTDMAADANDNALVTKVIDFGSGSTAKVTFDALVSAENDAVVAADNSGLNKNVITVDFKEAVKGGAVTGSATDGANYTLDGMSLDGAYITLSADKTVATIEVPAGTIDEDKDDVDLTIRNVKNTDGDTFATKTFSVNGLLDDTRAVSTSVQVVSDTLILTFNEVIDNTTLAELDQNLFDSTFELHVGSKTLTAEDFADATVVPVAGSTKKLQINLTPAEGSDWNSTKTITIKTLSGGDVTDLSRNSLKADTSVSN